MINIFYLILAIQIIPESPVFIGLELPELKNLDDTQQKMTCECYEFWGTEEDRSEGEESKYLEYLLVRNIIKLPNIITRKHSEE